MTIRIVADAAYPKSGLTLAELTEFVERATTTGCNPGDAVRVTSTFGGRVRQIGLIEPHGGRRAR